MSLPEVRDRSRAIRQGNSGSFAVNHLLFSIKRGERAAILGVCSDNLFVSIFQTQASMVHQHCGA